MTQPHAHELIQKLATLPKATVLVVGDVMLDRFIYGQVERISPEAPIPVLRFAREASMLGGAGNVVRNLISLGQQADLVAVIGGDAAGFELSKLLAEDEGTTSHLLTDQQRPTTVKMRYIAGVQQMLRCDHEGTSALGAEVESQIGSRIRMALPECAAVILSDYNKGVLTPKIIQETIKLAHELGKPVIVDPKVREYARYAGADVITPNRKELTEASGLSINTVEDAIHASTALIERYKFGAVLAKLGGDGVCLVRPGKEALHIPANAREVYDVSGAGDTVVAAFVTAMAAGIELELAALLANEAGSLVVSKIGTATISVDELVRSLRAGDSRELDDKVLTQPQALETVERWKRQGLTVGFTNGCFDLIHPGHISLLQQARKACDRLVVGLNSDASVKRLKGETRPLQTEHARATVLASLNPVDLVVIFGEDTPLELIRALRPGMLMKGADYALADVVGGKDVQGWGGQVLLANLVEGQSTTAIAAKMRETGT